MSEFGYNPENVAKVRESLEDINTQFTAAKEDLSSISSEVVSSWEASAQETFTALIGNFEQDSESLANVTTVISNWLDEMVAKYDKQNEDTDSAVSEVLH
nr:hypothetical protein [uncultured Butyrivibrio sp.]